MASPRHAPLQPLDASQHLLAVAAEGGCATLVSALEASPLARTLQGMGPFTLFAPTEAAFSRLPERARRFLLSAEGAAARAELLAYHIVPGHFGARDLLGREEVGTLMGPPLILFSQVRTIQVGMALIKQADLPARNGLVHLVDAVLRPPGRPWIA